MRVLPSHSLDKLLNDRHSGRSTDEYDFVNFFFTKLRILQRTLEWSHAALCQVVGQLLEFRTGDRLDQVLRSVLIGSDKRKVYFRLDDAGKLDLGFLRCLEHALQSL